MERFWSKVNVAGPSECWLWTGAKAYGYGMFHFNGALRRAHRVAYTISKGDIPEGLLVRHTCDVRSCVNPAHLVVGTVQDNTNDKIERGRQTRGEAHSTARLTEAEVASVFQMRQAGLSQQAIADHFGVAQTTISAICRRATWSHLAAPT